MMDKKERFRQLIKILKSATTITVISILGSIITMFCFVSGIPSLSDAIKKICPNTSKFSEVSSDFYTVKLVLPARMSGAEIFVDKQPAILIEQQVTVVTVRVQQKSTGYQFTVKKGDEVCDKQQFVNKTNVVIYPCQ